MATPRLGLVVEDKPTELSCMPEYGSCWFWGLPVGFIGENDGQLQGAKEVGLLIC